MNPLRTVASWLKRPILRRRLRRMLAERPGDSPLRIVIGAHRIFDRGWIPTERESLDLLDVSAWRRYFGEGSIDVLLAEHVWEHLTDEQGVEAARNCYRFLKPGGYIRVAVPDGLHPSPEYIERVRIGGSGPAASDHKVLYDYRSLSRVFAAAGLEVRLLEHYDEAGTFHLAEWDPSDGLIHRSHRFHRPKQAQPYRYTSLILDAKKPRDGA
jgi:predicted SAM-dependent methyltransferase